MRLYLVCLLCLVLSACGRTPGERLSHVAEPEDRALVHGAALAADGSRDLFVIGDFSSYRGVPVPRLVRLRPDGSRAPGFVPGRAFEALSPPPLFLANTDGTFYVAGGFSGGIVRLRADGGVDTRFRVGAGFGPAPSVYAMAPARDGTGDVYLAGNFTSYQGAAVGRVVRLRPDGSPRPGFSPPAFASAVSSLATRSDGSRVYCGGKGIVRLRGDGVIDTLFTTKVGLDEPVTAMALVGDDLYAVGGFSPVLVGPTGAVSAGFRPPPIPYSFGIDILVPLADGLLLGGPVFEVGNRWASMVKLAWTGAEIPAFDADLEREPRAVVPFPDGRIYIVGNFVEYRGEEARGIVRVHPDGRVDDSFVGGLGFRL